MDTIFKPCNRLCVEPSTPQISTFRWLLAKVTSLGGLIFLSIGANAPQFTLRWNFGIFCPSTSVFNSMWVNTIPKWQLVVYGIWVYHSFSAFSKFTKEFLPQAMQVQFNKREPVQKQATLLFHHETEKNASKKKVQVHQKGARLHKKTCFKPTPVLKNGNLSW